METILEHNITNQSWTPLGYDKFAFIFSFELTLESLFLWISKNRDLSLALSQRVSYDDATCNHAQSNNNKLQPKISSRLRMGCKVLFMQNDVVRIIMSSLHETTSVFCIFEI